MVTIALLALPTQKTRLPATFRRTLYTWGRSIQPFRYPCDPQFVMTLNNVISMSDRMTKTQASKAGVRDRRYAIRFPFAADVELIDMESGARIDGVTSDLSLGGCFVCTSKPLPIGTRVRISLSRKEDTVEALAVVRILKPRIGMGVEFIDVDAPYHEILVRWLDQVRRSR